MRKTDALKRLLVLQLSWLSFILQVVLFALFWYDQFADYIQVYFYKRGHWLVIAIYAVLLLFFLQMYGGFKVGYLKTSEVIFSQLFAVICVTILSYFQISLLIGFFVNPLPSFLVMLMDFAISLICIWTADKLYRKVFPPKKMLLVHGDRDIEDILRKFATRKEKYHIQKCMNIGIGLEEVTKEIKAGYDAIIVWDIPSEKRNSLLKYCYGHTIRVYTMPKITDVILRGSDQLHLFDTPILLTREYALTIGQRVVKRMIDFTCALLLLIVTLPITIVTAIIIKLYDRGPVLYKQVRCTRDQKEFYILKFRSMSVDAEKDGVARLAAKNDSRITPIGKFIRMVRIDELPQLINILKGEMSFIGPRPERPEIIAQYLEEMPEFAFRTKVKAGLAGYAQVFGKYNTTPYDKLKLDLFYIQNYSTWLDIKLMLLTLKILFRPESTEGVEETQKTALKEPSGNAENKDEKE